MKIEDWPIGKIIPYDKNAKIHNVDWIARSISEFRVDQPIVVDPSGVIIKGHGRLKAALQLGLKTFPVIVRSDLTPEQVRVARIADNRSNEGGWDHGMLVQELEEINSILPDFDLAALGMGDEWKCSFLSGDEEGFNLKNKELSGLVEPQEMVITLKFSEENYYKVIEGLKSICDKAEDAILSLLGLDNE
jgi:hypothetical protein